MAPPSNPSTDGPIAKRLHIGGLTNPKITHLDLEKRFSSFGKVEGVEGVGIDANGEFEARPLPADSVAVAMESPAWDM